MEAALTLPLFLSFVIAIISLIQISVAEMALQSAVSETTKLMAAHMYPVDVMYKEARSKWGQSKPYAIYSSVADKIAAARSAVQNSESFVENFAGFIPDPIVDLVRWEKVKREKMETMAQDEFTAYVEAVYKPLVNKAFTAIVSQYASGSVLKPEHLRVTDVKLPNLENKEEAFIGIEAEYELKLLVPFYRKTLVLRKSAVERAWVGAN
nr:pilus assembly protein [Paenibacillus hamazuiensis]